MYSIRFFFLLLFPLLLSCPSKKKSPSELKEKEVSFPPPEIVIATSPTVVNLDTVPALETIVIPTTPTVRTRINSNGKTIKLAPPLETKAGFFVTMPNYASEQGLAVNMVGCGYIDKMGNLWFGTYGGGVSRYDGKSFTNFSSAHGLVNNHVLCIMQDKTGNLWFGTDGGVSKYDGESFTNFTTKDGFATNAVWCITEDKKGNIWFGTYKGGVSKYDGNRVEAIERGENMPERERKDLKKSNGKFIKSFTTFTEAEGLASNRVQGIIEDRRGYLWIVTQGGVSKYNGKYFTNFTSKQGLVNNHVWCVAEDRRGYLWFGTSGGASRYDGNLVEAVEKGENVPEQDRRTLNKINGKFTESFTTVIPTLKLPSDFVMTIIEDKIGNLWFGSFGGGVCKYDGNRVDAIESGEIFSEQDQQDLKKENGKFVKSFTTFTTVQGLANNVVRSIIQDKIGNLWFGTYGGVNKYDGKSFTSFAPAQGIKNNNINCIVGDKSGNLWIGTDQGIRKYDGKYFTNFDYKQGLVNDPVTCFLVDKKENLWIGTEHGMSRYDGKSFVNYTFASGLPDSDVLCIAEDRIGNLWIGTYEGVSKYDGKSFTQYTTSQGLSSNVVNCILEDKIGNLWLGTQKGVSKYNGNRVERFESGENILERDQTDIKKINGKFVKSFTNLSNANGLANNNVKDILEDKNGNFWFATSGGLSLIRKENAASISEKKNGRKGKLFENFTVADGLSNDLIGQVIEDKYGNIILGTNDGLNLIKNSNNVSQELIYKPVVEIYNDKTGSPIKMTSSSFIDSKGIIWAGTGDKLVRFDYSGVYKSTDAPQIFIQNIKINNENISWYDLNSEVETEKFKVDSISTPPYVVEEVTTFGRVLTETQRDTLHNKFKDIQFSGITPFYPIPQNLVLPFEHNNITFEFAAIEPSRPNLVRYQYMLENYDKGWNPVTNKTTVSFGNIDAGEYTFKLKAQSPDGVWSKPISYTFKVLPPWYKTWWADGIYVIAIAGLLFIGYRWRTTALRKDREVLEKTVRERTTELEAQMIESERQKQLAEKSAKIKDEFLSNMSHEIRTPLNAIIGYTDINLQQDLPEQVKNNLKAVKLSSNHLRRLVNDILDYEKIESGKFSFCEVDFDLAETLEEVKHLLYFQALKKGNVLSFSIYKDVPKILFGDKERLMQVLINLLDNAIKFTLNGRIEITIQLVENDNTSPKILFTITDTGVGIPSEKLETIFEGFIQADNSISRKFGGTGLGLTISKKIIELQGGTIKVSSIVNEGASFTFQIPYKIGRDLEPIQEPCTQAQNYLPFSLHVLAAEDDLINQDLLASILKKWKIKVDFAETGEMLLELLQKHTYHLVLLDIHMPGMNGFDVADKIRTTFVSPVKDIPILALTADVLPRTREKMTASGINDYIYKPIDSNVLYSKITSLLCINSAVEENNSGNNKWKIATEHLNLSYLINNYSSNKGDMLNMLSKGAWMLNQNNEALLIACRDKKYEEMFFIAHKLVTAAEMLGIHSVRQKLDEMQELVISGKPDKIIFATVESINSIIQIAYKEANDIIGYISKN